MGKVIADILGYQNGSRDINRHVDKEDKTTLLLEQDGIEENKQTKRIVIAGQNTE